MASNAIELIVWGIGTILAFVAYGWIDGKIANKKDYPNR